MTEDKYREELMNVVVNAPVEPGCTISHATAYECARRGWIRRDGNNNWVPTDAGRRAHLVGPLPELGKGKRK